MFKYWTSAAFRNDLKATRKPHKNTPGRRLIPQLEELEVRSLLSGTPPPIHLPVHNLPPTLPGPVTPPPSDPVPVAPTRPVNPVNPPILLPNPVSPPINDNPPPVGPPSAPLVAQHIVVVQGPNGTFIPATTLTNNGTSSPSGNGFIPSQIESAYGIDQIKFGSVVGNGQGQTIAIVDAYDDPKFVSSSDVNFANSDLHQFDLQFNIPEPTGFFTKLDQNGGTNYPKVDGGWCGEIALDVEWAHALAPMAKIVLVEGNSAYNNDLVAGAVNTARNLPGVSVVSMSFGIDDQLSDPGNFDQYLTTPPGHQPITFLAATGDLGAQGGWPAYSPTVVAVGGTFLTLNSTNNYVSETGWGDGLTKAQGSTGGSGGGIGNVYPEPSYQQILIKSTTYGGFRTNPDVSFDASPESPVVTYESYNNGSPMITSPLSTTAWSGVGGTSFACPAWGALIAIANQGRILNSHPTLDGVNDVLKGLYTLGNQQYNSNGQADFHDITSGNNGYAAGLGYDLVTGIGSPIANKLIQDLAGPPVDTNGTVTHFSVISNVSTIGAGNSISVTVSALDKQNLVVTGYTGTVHFTSSDSSATLPANYTFKASDSGVHTFSVVLTHQGSQSVTVKDTKTPTIQGSTSVVVTPGVATHFAETGVQNNLVFTMTVTALDAYGNIATSFTGTVNFSSPNAHNMPPSYTFQASDNGVHSFTMSLAGLSYGVYDVFISSAGLQTLDGKEWKLYGHTHP